MKCGHHRILILTVEVVAIWVAQELHEVVDELWPLEKGTTFSTT